MSDPENFLSRWSRRKREVLRETESVIQPPEAARDRPVEKDRVSGKGLPRSALASPEPIFDPASLPPIQSITAETDIRGFLGAGVPSELTRAALRRAWACDPKIRNFVGLAEYDWDFNAADSMAGFGPLQMTDDVRKMVAQIVEPNRPEPGVSDLLDSAPTTPRAEQVVGKTNTDTARGAAAEMHDQAKHRDEPAKEIGTPPHPNELTHREHGPIAAQHTAMEPDKRNVFVKRQHGGALPK
jgi:hypothetical protein